MFMLRSILRRRRHSPLLALVVLATVGAAACGSSVSRTDPAPTYPTSSDIALVRIGRDGNLPQLVIGGDGWVYFPSAESPTGGVSTSDSASGFVGSGRVSSRPAAIPAPPEPTPVERRRLTPAGIAIVMDLADELGLLATPGPYEDPGITDMSTTDVTLVDGAGTYVHDASALGFDDETGNRKDLLDFVTAVGDLRSLVGSDNLGPAEAYVPELFAVSIGGAAYSADGPADWPAGVALEEGCIRLPVAEFPTGVAGIYVADVDGTATRITVVPDLPGDDCG